LVTVTVVTEPPAMVDLEVMVSVDVTVTYSEVVAVTSPGVPGWTGAPVTTGQLGQLGAAAVTVMMMVE